MTIFNKNIFLRRALHYVVSYIVSIYHLSFWGEIENGFEGKKMEMDFNPYFEKVRGKVVVLRD